MSENKSFPKIGDVLINCTITIGQNYKETQTINLEEILFDPIFVNKTAIEDRYIITYCANPVPSEGRIQLQQM